MLARVWSASYQFSWVVHQIPISGTPSIWESCCLASVHPLLKLVSVVGIEALQVGVEVDVSGGLPGITVVGLPDAAVQESRERVKSALRNAGLSYPMRRIVINLTPADLRKEGPSFDLPISVGILAASEQVDAAQLAQYLFVGEVSLDGSL